MPMDARIREQDLQALSFALDAEICDRARLRRDPAFDGLFFPAYAQRASIVDRFVL